MKNFTLLMLKAELILLLCFCLVNGLLEKNKGDNDWKIENIGEIIDMKFVEDSNQIYILSKSTLETNLLSLFDASNQQFLWKKKLPQIESTNENKIDEKFNLQYLAKNLLVHSEKRAILTNTAGQINFEIEYGMLFGEKVLRNSKQHPKAQLFSNNGDIVICFAFNNKAYFFSNAEYWGVISLVESQNVLEDFDVLQTLFDQTEKQFSILVRSQNTLKSISIDLQNLQIESENKIDSTYSIKDVQKSKSFYIITTQEDQTIFLDPYKLNTVFETSDEFQFSSFDDIILLQNSNQNDAIIVDLNSKTQDKIVSKKQRETNCSKFVRFQTQQDQELNEYLIAQSCQNYFKIYKQDENGSLTENYESHLISKNLNGDISGLWMRKDKHENIYRIIQMQDLSLNFLLGPQSAQAIQWTRQEGLSVIKQVEIVEKVQEFNIKTKEYEYVKNWLVNTDILSIPSRIIQRYAENFSHLFQYLFSTKSVSVQDIRQEETDIFGYQKLIIALSECGKIFALQSKDGSILWSSNFIGKTQKIILRNIYSRQLQAHQTQIVSIHDDQIQYFDAFNGKFLFSEQFINHDQNKFLVVNLKGIQNTLIISINDEIQNNIKLDIFPKKEILPHHNLEIEKIHFTSIRQGKLIGYKITKDWQSEKLWQIDLDLNENEKIEKIVSQQQTQSDIEKQHFLPTSFVGDNLIYKYLDSNLFALCVSDSISQQLSIYVINGVSGKIIYKFKENDVDLDSPIRFFFQENILIMAFRRISESLYGSKIGLLSQQQLSVVEFFQSREESDTLQMLKEFYFGKNSRLVQTSFSSFDNEMPVVAHQTYILTVDVKQIALTQSIQQVTNKMLVLITSKDQVYTIEYNVYTARRLTEAESKAITEKEQEIKSNFGKYNISTYEEKEINVKTKEFPFYDAVIPQTNTRFVTYDLKLVDLRNLVTFSTRLESTSVVFTFGHDLFAARINPESNFDRLHENFKVNLFLGTIGVLITALYIGHSYLKTTEIQEQFSQ